MLLKMALLLGIEIHVNVEFKALIEPPEDQEAESKWASTKTVEKWTEKHVFHQGTICQRLWAGALGAFVSVLCQG